MHMLTWSIYGVTFVLFNESYMLGRLLKKKEHDNHQFHRLLVYFANCAFKSEHKKNIQMFDN